MNLGIIFGGLSRELYSGCGSPGSGIVNSDIESINRMLKDSRKGGYGITSDCTAGLRKRIGETVRRYLKLQNPSAKRRGLNQLLYVINKQLPKIRGYYGKYSYSEAAGALIDYLESQKTSIEGVL